MNNMQRIKHLFSSFYLKLLFVSLFISTLAGKVDFDPIKPFLKFVEHCYQEKTYNKNFDKLLIELKQKAENNDANAQYLLGLVYEYGIGIKSDYQKSNIYYDIAAKENPFAQRAVEELKKEVIGGFQNINRSVEFYAFAINYGYAPAFHLLADIQKDHLTFLYKPGIKEIFWPYKFLADNDGQLEQLFLIIQSFFSCQFDLAYNYCIRTAKNHNFAQLCLEIFFENNGFIDDALSNEGLEKYNDDIDLVRALWYSMISDMKAKSIIYSLLDKGNEIAPILLSLSRFYSLDIGYEFEVDYDFIYSCFERFYLNRSPFFLILLEMIKNENRESNLLLEKAAEAEYIPAIFFYGLNLWHKGRKQEAKSYFLKLPNAGNNTIAAFFLSDIYASEGDIEQAKKYFVQLSKDFFEEFDEEAYNELREKIYQEN